MPFSVHWMERDVWQLVTSQGTDCTDDEYRLAEKIILRIGPAYEWPRRAILTFAGESSPDSDKSSDGGGGASRARARASDLELAHFLRGVCRRRWPAGRRPRTTNVKIYGRLPT